MKIQTRITELLGVRYPIIQGGMMWWALRKWSVQSQMQVVWEH